MKQVRVVALLAQLSTVFGLVACAHAEAPGTHEAQCMAPIATYHVEQADADTFSIDASLSIPSSRFDLFFFPIADRPEGQAESILALQGYSEAGEPIALEYIGEGGWQTTASETVTRLTYQVRADHDEADWKGGPGKDEVATRFDDTYFFVGHAFFLIDYDWPLCPVDVEFDVPETWTITSPWPMKGRTVTAANPGNLSKNAFAMGLAKPQTFQASGLDITLLMATEANSFKAPLIKLMDVIPQTYIDFFGGAPGSQYTTFIFTDTMLDGGAFENSFAMRIASPTLSTDEIVMTHTLGHEMMHLWNGAGAIRGVHPEETYWFTEGFTDYLTIKLMRKAGLIDDALLQQRIANILRRYELAKRLSPDVSLAEAGSNKTENWELLYGGGAFVALMLDGELSQQDPDAFQGVMRDVYEHSQEPFELAELMARLDATTNGLASQTVAWVNSAPPTHEIRAKVSSLGINASMFRDEVYVDFPDCGKADCTPSFLAGPATD